MKTRIIPTSPGRRRFLVSATALALGCAIQPSLLHAASPGMSIVFDPTNFAESVRQTTAWARDYAMKLQDYLAQINKWKTMIEQLAEMKKMAVKDFLGMMGLTDIFETIRTVQQTIDVARNTYSDLRNFGDMYRNVLGEIAAGNITPRQWLELQRAKGATGTRMEKQEVERRVGMMQSVEANVRQLQRLARTVNSKSLQSGIDGVNSHLNLVANTLNQLTVATLQEGQINAARRMASDEDSQLAMEALKRRNDRNEAILRRLEAMLPAKS